MATATATSPTTILLLFKPSTGTQLLDATYETDKPGDVQPGPMGGHGVSGFTVDEVFLNDSGAEITAGNWVSRDLAPLASATLSLWLNRSTHPYPVEYLYRRAKQAPASADAHGVVGVALETAADGATFRVRRQGLIIPEVHGVTPTLSVSGSSDTVYGLQISGTAGTAEVAGATTERCIGYLLVSLGTADDDVVEVSCL